MEKEIIKDVFFEGERPLFGRDNVRLERLKFYPGESAVKECRHVEAYRCEFWGKYPFWHNDDTRIEECEFTVYARAAIWYSKNIFMRRTRVDAPKMFRQIDGLRLEEVKLTTAGECCWFCRDLTLRDVDVKGGDYIFMCSENIDIDGFTLQGNYSFQDARNVVVRNARMESKDAFWHTENVTVYDSYINGEYLGWYSKNLKLVNCVIGGTQAMCYIDNLVLEDCTLLPDCDLNFEYSTVQATIKGGITSVKNPGKGFIKAERIGDIVLDNRCPAESAVITLTANQ
ncbi:MAG: DUF3737 family protein [Mediterranea sp.]|jgi:hypothetical protein|nr:DUF3737 family protein [Mediterranea sp.]